MSEKTIYVHIGTHKTGTTTIQFALRKFSTELKDEGIFIPSSGTIDLSSGHHNIAWELREANSYRKEYGNLENLISEIKLSTCNKVVISSEDFEYLSQYPSKIVFLDRTLNAAGFVPKYICYYRNWESYLLSLHDELLTHGLSMSLDQMRDYIEEKGFFIHNKDWYFDFNNEVIIDKWQALVGNRFKMLSYDEAVGNGGLLMSFFSYIGASHNISTDSNNLPHLNTRRNIRV